jgi:exopolyphosphatase/guanosine-5'-triphosphate,3'-diphosphate pyrophosphatase
MRIAVVDIGTNSTRLLICDRDGDRITDELERHSNVTRLGAGVDADGRLDQEAMERVYQVVDEYKELIERHGAEHRIAVLTSAVRDAANGPAFAESIKKRYDLEPHVITGDEEARLTFTGATSERDPGDQTPSVVVDIGGGSTEIVVGRGHDVTFHVSTQAGVVRQTERHLHDDPPTEAELDETRRDVRETLSHGVPETQRDAVEHAIAVAGTATSLGAIAQELEPYDPDKVHGYRLNREQCEQILERLAALPLSERKEVPGLHPDRAPTIVAGVIILVEVLRLFRLDEVEVSEHDILRGAALGLVEA